MFHLVNKCYLGFDFAKGGAVDYMIISRKWGAYPYDPVNDPHVKFVALTFEDMIEENFNGDTDTFITYITRYPKGTELRIYCDIDAFTDVMARWLKALLPNVDSDTAYITYKLTVDKIRMFHSQVPDFPASHHEGYAKLKPWPKSSFQAVFTGMEPISELTPLVRQSSSMEWLIATYLKQPDSFYTEEIDKRVRKLLWKLVGWEVNELKQNLLNGLLDMHHMFETVTADSHPDTDLWARVLDSEPTLKFVQDPDCSPHNTDIIRHYGLGFFTDIWSKYMEYMGNPDRVLLAIFECVKNPDYTVGDILQIDMDQKFGSQVFARAEYNLTMNPLLISYLYRLKRKGYAAELGRFSLVASNMES